MSIVLQKNLKKHITSNLKTIIFGFATKYEIESLLKETLEEAKKFNNYNFKEYFTRRTNEVFDEFWKTNEKDESKIQQFYDERKQELEVLKRQTKIDNLYSTKKFVIDSDEKK
ncbi:hypothetical protein M0811_06662 [Anaeramoeba ignava]|uniref:Uncharacterized protein n=1 Tax=Anaeramoeba ignava TaxID=1746090 RepID=A0A9Q0LR95_ANAIG|nr:hypothetical protein M0811_06662 [Anaeramoeba ignava]